MAVMHLGLVCSGLAFLYVGWASWSAGYTPEVAALRALVAFMAVNFVGYMGQLIVVTQPPKRAVEEEESTAQAADAGSADGPPALEIVPPAAASSESDAERLAA